MDLALRPETRDYRDGLRAWVDEHLPDAWRDVPVGTGDDQAYVAMRREWGRMLHCAGWLAPHWPVAHGVAAHPGFAQHQRPSGAGVTVHALHHPHRHHPR